jgi:MFS family permease
MAPPPSAIADLRVLFASRMVRLFACGLMAVILVLHLRAIGLTPERVGWLLALTFLGDAAVSLWLTTHADRWGRRRTLRVGAALMVFGGAGLALTDNFTLLVIAATLGVISPTGAEVGPFLAVEQACLAQVVPAKSRTHFFAWYHVAGFSMSALGALGGGWLASALQARGWDPAASYRALLWIFAACGGLLGCISLRLGSGVEEKAGTETTGTFGLGESRRVVLRLSALFALDSFGGGFCVQSFVAYWFHVKFAATEAMLGTIFFGTNLLAGLSALAAVPLARRFGLINTMVWTHLPSSGLLMLVPLMPTLEAAIAVFWLRNSISQMDVPARQSYVNAIVPPHVRSAANGVTSTAKQLGTALAPLLAAPLLASTAWMSAPFFICGGAKITYDLLLWRAFRKVKPPEET